jgi:hypothetical protein
MSLSRARERVPPPRSQDRIDRLLTFPISAIHPASRAAVGVPTNPYDPNNRVVEESRGPSIAEYDTLLDAVQRQNTPLVEELMAALLQNPRIQVDRRLYNDSTLLMMAADTGATTALRALLARGADATMRNADDMSVIMFAISHNHGEAVTILADAGVDVNGGDNADRLIVYAANNNAPAAVQALVDAGADINYQKRNGVTALSAAAEAGYLDVCRVLVRAGANVKTRDRDGDTPLSMAMERGFKEIVALLATKDRYFETAAPVYLPDSLTVTRGRVNESRGLACFSYTHKWDGFLNLWRRYGRNAPRYIRPFDTTASDYVAVFAYFCPMKYLRDVLDKPDLKEDDIVVKRLEPDEDDTDPDRCPLDLYIGRSAPWGSRMKATLISELLRPIGRTSDDGFADELTKLQANNAFADTLERLDAALVAACVKLGRKTVYRYIETDDTADTIMARSNLAWTSTAVNEELAANFCRGGGGSCTRLVIDIAQDTVGLYLPAILKRPWVCYEEEEIVLAPGCTYTYTENIVQQVEQSIRTIKVKVHGGRRASWLYDPEQEEGRWVA